MPLPFTIVLVLVVSWVAGWRTATANAFRDGPSNRVTHRGTSSLPASATDRDGREVAIAGVSGITWMGGDRYAAVMDNSDVVILFRLPLQADGSPTKPDAVEIVRLAEVHDYEDIAACPETFLGVIAGSHEQRGRCVLVCEEDTPAIHVAALGDGRLLETLAIPPAFANRRPNRGLESLCFEPDGLAMWTANEEALPEDGPAPGLGTGTIVRLARSPASSADRQGVAAWTSIAYSVDAPHDFVRIFDGVSLSGVVALACIRKGALLVLERSGCPGLPPFENRLYAVDVSVTTRRGDTPENAASTDAGVVGKDLLWRAQLGCNLEGLCVGPRLPDGSTALLTVADSGGPGTPHQIVVLAVAADATPLPPFIVVAAVAAAALGIALALGRRAR